MAITCFLKWATRLPLSAPVMALILVAFLHRLGLEVFDGHRKKKVSISDVPWVHLLDFFSFFRVLFDSYLRSLHTFYRSSWQFIPRHAHEYISTKFYHDLSHLTAC